MVVVLIKKPNIGQKIRREVIAMLARVLSFFVPSRQQLGYAAVATPRPTEKQLREAYDRRKTSDGIPLIAKGKNDPTYRSIYV